MNPRLIKLSGAVGLYNDYRGDFRQAALVTDQAIREKTTSHTLVDRAIVHLLQGEINRALSLLEQASLMSELDPDASFRALAYSFLAHVMNWAWYPGGYDINCPDLRVYGEYVLVRALADYEAKKKLLLERVTNSSVRIEENAFMKLFYTPLGGRQVAIGARMSQHKFFADSVKHFLPTTFRAEAEKMGEKSLAAMAHRVSAELMWCAGMYDESLAMIQSAMHSYTSLDDLVGVAACVLTTGDWLCAPSSTPECLNFVLRESTSSDGSLSYEADTIEFARPSAQIIEGARERYAQSETLFRSMDAWRGIASVMLRYGYLALLDRDYRIAAAFADKAFDTYALVGDAYGSQLSQTHRILYRVAAGDRPEALETATSIGQWGKASGSFSYALGLGILIVRFAYHLLAREGDYEGSLACFRMGEALFKALGAPLNRIYTIMQYAKLYQLIGDTATAVVLFERAADEIEAATETYPYLNNDLKTQLGSIIPALHNLYIGERDSEGMRRTYERARRGLADIQKTPEPSDSDDMQVKMKQVSWMVALGVTSTGLVLSELYDAERALDDGDEEQAIQLFAKAEDAALKTDTSMRAYMLTVVYATQKKYDIALQMLQSYVDSEAPGWRGGLSGHLATLRTAIAPPNANSMQGQMAQLVKGLGAPVFKAIIERKMRTQTLSVAFTAAVRCKGWKQAQEYAKALENAAGKEWWLNEKQPWEYLGDLGAMYEGVHNPKTACVYYDKGLELFEQRRSGLSREELKTALSGGRGIQYIYFQAARTALNQETPQAAVGLNYIERSKARTLLDRIATSDVDIIEAEDDPIRDWRHKNGQLNIWRGLLAREHNKEESNETLIADYTSRIQTEESNLHQTEQRLAQNYPNFYELIRSNANVITPDVLRTHLAEETLLLEYAFLGDDFLGWAITSKGVVKTHYSNLDARVLNRKINTFRTACATQERSEMLAAELSDIFFTPFAEVMSRAKHIIFVPHGTAHSLPFAALPLKGHHLIGTHSIAYLPSASIMQYLSGPPVISAEMQKLVIGNPTLDLPASAIEAQQIVRLLNADILLESDAKKGEIIRQIPNYSLFHLATHSILREESPLMSAIALANKEELTVYELMALQMDAQLVVLSSCDSARGEITRGDELLGLTRGLMAAGAKSVIASLWEIGDQSTSLLMTKFYQASLEGTPPAQALAEAQYWLANAKRDTLCAAYVDANNFKQARFLKERFKSDEAPYRNPYYWSAFTYHGL
jgi:CHAT domain-containing protein